MTITDHGYDSLIATNIAISILTELPNALTEYVRSTTVRVVGTIQATRYPGTQEWYCIIMTTIEIK